MPTPSEDGQPADEQARARALALLEAVHQFPGEYAVTVIALNQDSITQAIRGAACSARSAPADTDFVAYEARSSREGKYLSHRFTVRVAHAGEVLDLYGRLRALEGVLTIL